jgi:hypothetical protein
MGRGDDMSIRYIQPAPNPYANAFGLLGMILGNNAADREQSKVNDALLKFGTDPGNTSFSTTTMDGQSIFNKDYATAPAGQQYTPQNGLLSGVTTGQFKLDPGTPAPTDGTPINEQAPAPTPKFQTTTKDWSAVQRDYRQDRYAKLKELQKEMGAAAFNKAMPQLMAQIKEGETALQSDYTQKGINTALAGFNNAKDRKEAAKYAMTLNQYGVKGVGEMYKNMYPGAKYEIAPDGTMYDSSTGTTTGDKGQFAKGLTPFEKEQIEGRKAGWWSPSRGSNGAAGERYVQTPYGPMTGGQLFNAIKEAEGGEVETSDELGRKTIKKMPRNEAVLKNLLPLVQGGGGQPQATPAQPQNPDGAAWYSNTFEKIKAENPGMSDQDVTDYMTYLIKQNGG